MLSWIVSHVLFCVSVMLDSLSCVMLCKCHVGYSLIVSHVLCYVSVMLDSLSCFMLCKCHVG